MTAGTPEPDGSTDLFASLPPELQQAWAEAAGLGLGGAAAEPVSLAEALFNTSMSVAGRRGLTGSPFSGILPPWAQGLQKDILDNPDFDPYLGIVSQQGDEHVYMGPKIEKTGAKPKYEGGGEFELPQDLRRRQTGDDEAGGFSGAWDAAKHATVDTGGEATVTQVLNLPYTWDQDKVLEVMKRMRESGINVTTFDQMNQVWTGLVDRASKMYSLSSGKTQVTPWDVLDMHKSELKDSGALVDYESGREVTTQKSVANITEGQAWASIQQQLAQMLGRDPSDQEVRDFTYRMNALAAKNPSISKTITQYKGGKAVSTSTTTDGGFTSADMEQQAYESAQNDPDYAEYQSATTYFNAAQSALGAIGMT